MKKYFLHNGSENIGPFDIEELKERKITKETPIWYEGLEHWKDASEIEELKSILLITPPPLTKKTTTQSFEKTKTSEPKKKNLFVKGLKIIAIILLVFMGISFIVSIINNSSDPNHNYEESVMTIEEIEAQSPLNYLTTAGSYNENFFGDKIKINGTITNIATLTTYKDLILKVHYYSKTKTLIGSEDYTLYEFYPPSTTSDFKLKVNNYNNVASLGWEIVDASIKE